ncbi:hypothetical protein BO82DRAFT_54689 [Aspergillus uvarum CBS 121591]|uniref:Uncharacterized protein n=1 Tax=Aspergillus uvarum CBS 121591 TaxID=1448315 RepID=A0A319CN68_9EURO|nr:hypothetical protein BO82DRAFT_54689 [Aspergillus uvarum CBS 121591]PYH86946.1 hypothetical protein BO82DRAFT_54689 [Aspergillus uvarum CBS 121591]
MNRGRGLTSSLSLFLSASLQFYIVLNSSRDLRCNICLPSCLYAILYLCCAGIPARPPSLTRDLVRFSRPTANQAHPVNFLVLPGHGKSDHSNSMLQ